MILNGLHGGLGVAAIQETLHLNRARTRLVRVDRQNLRHDIAQAGIIGFPETLRQARENLHVFFVQIECFLIILGGQGVIGLAKGQAARADESGKIIRSAFVEHLIDGIQDHLGILAGEFGNLAIDQQVIFRPSPSIK